jgi:hypothetical protein
MAKKASTKKASTRKSTASDSSVAVSVAVYLIKQTARGARLTPKEHTDDINRINDYIREAGGTCSLFGNKAEKEKPNEFVSIIRGLPSARQEQMVEVIERGGGVQALKMHPLKD